MSIIDSVINFFKMLRSKSEGKEKLELFNVSQYDRPGYSNYKKCPHCGIEANTNDEVKTVFGLMNVGGHIYSQSWCKECRKTQPQEESLKEDSRGEDIFS